MIVKDRGGCPGTSRNGLQAKSPTELHGLQLHAPQQTGPDVCNRQAILYLMDGWPFCELRVRRAYEAAVANIEVVGRAKREICRTRTEQPAAPQQTLQVHAARKETFADDCPSFQEVITNVRPKFGQHEQTKIRSDRKGSPPAASKRL